MPSSFSRRSYKRSQAACVAVVRCAVCRMCSPSSASPYISRISSTSFLPFRRGTEKPNFVWTHSPFPCVQAIMSFSIRFCHSCALRPLVLYKAAALVPRLRRYGRICDCVGVCRPFRLAISAPLDLFHHVLKHSVQVHFVQIEPVSILQRILSRFLLCISVLDHECRLTRKRIDPEKRSICGNKKLLIIQNDRPVLRRKRLPHVS